MTVQSKTKSKSVVEERLDTTEMSNLPRRFGFATQGLSDPALDSLPLADRVAAKLLAFQAEAAPQRTFVHFKGQSLTYREADHRAIRCANALAAHDIGRGSRVAVLLSNRLEFLDLWFGLTRLGAVQVPINIEYKSAQIVQLFRRSAIEAVVVESGLLDELLLALDVLQCSIKIFLITDPQTVVTAAGAAPTAARAKKDPRVADAVDFSAALADASESKLTDLPAVSGGDLGVIMNTSGTTGPSKGVMLSHAQQYILGRMIAADMNLGPDDVYYNSFPLFHNTAQAMIALPVLLTGASMVLVERFSASRFWPDIISHRCTAFYYIGEIVRILLKSTTAADAIGAQLRVGWGIGASAKDFARFGSQFNVAMRTGYGSTEANVPCYLPHGSEKLQSCGRVAPGFEIQICDETGAAVTPGEVGEILIRSTEPFAMMIGYDNDPAATAEAWREGWFHSGDAGKLDLDGDLFFQGRLKDSIRIRGENVSAFEVEQAISEVDGVLEVAAIAVPSELGGDDLKIVVVKRVGSAIGPENLIDHSRRVLPRYSVPRYVEFSDALPKTPTNKVQKHLLRKDPFTPNTWDRDSAKQGSTH
jgi:crotonobetaine/carnitine-CoA ligase